MNTIEEKVKEFDDTFPEISWDFTSKNKDKSVHSFLRQALQEVYTQGGLDERKRIEKDMLVKMNGWHGTGRAMVVDYFASLKESLINI